MSQQELAEKIKTPQTTISAWERGVTMPNANQQAPQQTPPSGMRVPVFGNQGANAANIGVPKQDFYKANGIDIPVWMRSNK